MSCKHGYPHGLRSIGKDPRATTNDSSRQNDNDSGQSSSISKAFGFT